MKDYEGFREDTIRPEGGFMFYLYYLFANPGPNVPLHWHDEYEIMLSKAEGYMLLDGKKIDFREDDILFINPRQLHYTYHIKPGWSYHILLHPDLFCTQTILKDKNKRFYFPEKIEAVNEPCKKILEELLQIPLPISETDKMFVMSKIFEMLFHLMEDGYSIIEDGPTITSQTGYIKMALEYIEQNINHKIPVANIADEIGISKEYLMRLFKTYTGETINSYINGHRLEAARGDLAAGYSLTDVVYKYDYSDVAYFCRLFKKQYGISPGKFMCKKY